jgi:hypothetical protein
VLPGASVQLGVRFTGWTAHKTAHKAPRLYELVFVSMMWYNYVNYYSARGYVAAWASARFF